ncbi:DUF993 family protein [Streptomyces tsukubensis]|uniref:DUF993 domain-containing protein n=1 Tax=Streptomyces tsukubensis (strain DSM 42081 / NBRC 108919 / NRRL 18488 / 9993) TaxID=1114943 RepID=I2MYH7_STRT9|nr:dihydrodipicolinate synthase family protein [Streptomyces tsukubensis]EIF89824.1 hypothetical protein [Streptomyces tsukubensis NRRL18488]MYS63495.1 DUF993 family protein [Streptomyces sp. SID5473]QKM69745.1 DUF993 domain-containing protein [Streptomyces tsukubensis NRRL18488]TAI46288.1 DUF993 family protein [Streptomyces tsukubensis]
MTDTRPASADRPPDPASDRPSDRGPDPAPGSAHRPPAPGAVSPQPRPRSRRFFAAAHIVAAPAPASGPTGNTTAVDWDATLAFRRHLWAHGLGVAEAMDTAQRGAGLDWPAAAELISRTAAEAIAGGGDLVCGAGTDQLTGPATLPDVLAAYEEQLARVERHGARAVLLASRALAATARSPEDYQHVYGELLRQARSPVILHWLGPAFDPALGGYWGSDDRATATDTLLAVVAARPHKVDGVKISLLDAAHETALRRRLPPGVRCYTGDDFHYPELIAGDEHGHSDALLGVFDPLAPLAAEALRALDDRGPEAFRAVLDPTVELARHLFAPPTRHYKTGVVFLAWLAGHQRRFTMAGGLHTARPLAHLARAHELATRLGLFPDPEAARARMASLLTPAGA